MGLAKALFQESGNGDAFQMAQLPETSATAMRAGLHRPHYFRKEPSVQIRRIRVALPATGRGEKVARGRSRQCCSVHNRGFPGPRVGDCLIVAAARLARTGLARCSRSARCEVFAPGSAHPRRRMRDVLGLLQNRQNQYDFQIGAWHRVCGWGATWTAPGSLRALALLERMRGIRSRGT
jgi:hypothetical protein